MSPRLTTQQASRASPSSTLDSTTLFRIRSQCNTDANLPTCRHFLELIHTDSFKELGLRTPSLMVEIQESFAHYNGIRKRATAIPDDEPKKRQYRAPK